MAVMVSVRSVFLLLFMCAFGLAHRLQGVHQSGLAPEVGPTPLRIFGFICRIGVNCLKNEVGRYRILTDRLTPLN